MDLLESVDVMANNSFVISDRDEENFVNWGKGEGRAGGGVSAFKFVYFARVDVEVSHPTRRRGAP